MPYKVIDMFKELPKTNCAECNRPGCFQFATAVYLENVPLSDCPYLSPEELEEMNGKLEAQRLIDSGGKKPKGDSAAEFLFEQIEKADFLAVAEKCGAVYDSGPPEMLRLSFFNTPFEVRHDDVSRAEGMAESNVFIKILMLIYATHAKGSKAAGQMVAFRDLPNTSSKSKSFDHNANKLAKAFAGRIEALDEACRRIGGKVQPSDSADREYRFDALPRVPVQFLFWDGDDDFPARASVLLDKNVLDYLDQEAIVFMSEAFANLLMGKGLDDLVA